MLCLLITVAGWFTTLPVVFDRASALLALAATILFLVFLKRVAGYVQDSKSEQRAGNVLKIGIGVFAAVLIGIFFPPLLLVALLLLLVGFLIYIRLLISLREPGSGLTLSLNRPGAGRELECHKRRAMAHRQETSRRSPEPGAIPSDATPHSVSRNAGETETDGWLQREPGL